MIELSIKVSDDENTLTSKYLIHEEGISLSHDDLTLSKLVQETLAKFKGEVKDVLIKVRFAW